MSRIRWSIACVVRRTPVTLTASTRRHSDLGGGRGYGLLWWTVAADASGDSISTREPLFYASGYGGHPQPGPVTVTGPSGAERSVAVRDEKPGLYAAQLQTRELGLHSIRSGDLVAFVSVGPANPRELADVFSDTERLRPIAEATGGSVRRIAADAAQ